MSTIVIFSIAQTLGVLTLPGGHAARAQLEPYPEVPGLLRKLEQQGIAVGVEIPDARFDRDAVLALLDGAGLVGFVDPELVQRAPFPAVANDARAFYVSRDRFARRAAGPAFRGVPDAALLPAALRGEPLLFVRATPKTPLPPDLSWRRVLAGLEVVPLAFEAADAPALLAVASQTGARDLAGHMPLERLGPAGLPEKADLVLFQVPFVTAAAREFHARLRRLPVFVETSRGAVVALDAEQPPDAFHPPEDDHGHTRALLPSATLVPDDPPAASPEAAATPGPRELDEVEKKALAKLDADLLEQGLASLGGELEECAASIESRFLYHPHNKLAVTALVCELERILSDAHTHAFTLGGVHENVFGDLPGKSGDLVVLGAHLDATAARDGGCGAGDTGCKALGVDDDGSGVAALLAIATVFEKLRQDGHVPQYTVRFVFFNAEEQGMVGSEAYALDLKQQGKPVRGMFQLDMIGTPGLDPSPEVPPPHYEVHTAGDADLGPVIYQIAAAQEGLRAALVGATQTLSPQLAVQHYPRPGCSSDPGAGRSDHTSFQLEGYPACYVSEGLWADDCSSAMRAHPTYHRQSDLSIDSAYAADIARAVAGAAWLVANP